MIIVANNRENTLSVSHKNGFFELRIECAVFEFQNRRSDLQKKDLKVIMHLKLLRRKLPPSERLAIMVTKRTVFIMVHILFRLSIYFEFFF